MNVLTLEAGCVRHVALWPPPGAPATTNLPPAIAAKVQQLCDEVTLFIRLHSQLLHIKRQWIVVNDQCCIDWPGTFRQCITSAPPEQAFKFAAANAVEEDCTKIWQNLNETSRRKLREALNVVIRSAAWQAAGFHYLIFYEHVCCTAARNGWPNALKLWLSRVPTDELDLLCSRLALIAVCHQQYHLLDMLPKYDHYPFNFIFPHGRIHSKFVQKLANTPSRWKRLMLNIAKAFIRWAARKDIDQIRIEFYSSVDTAGYGRFIDCLLARCQNAA